MASQGTTVAKRNRSTLEAESCSGSWGVGRTVLCDLDLKIDHRAALQAPEPPAVSVAGHSDVFSWTIGRGRDPCHYRGLDGHGGGGGYVDGHPAGDVIHLEKHRERV